MSPTAAVGMPVRTDRIHRYVTAFCPRCHDEEPGRPLDHGIVRALWLPYDEIVARRDEHRSPLVLRCIDDYRAGLRWPLDLVQDVVGEGAGVLVR